MRFKPATFRSVFHRISPTTSAELRFSYQPLEMSSIIGTTSELAVIGEEALLDKETGTSSVSLLFRLRHRKGLQCSYLVQLWKRTVIGDDKITINVPGKQNAGETFFTIPNLDFDTYYHFKVGKICNLTKLSPDKVENILPSSYRTASCWSLAVIPIDTCVIPPPNTVTTELLDQGDMDNISAKYKWQNPPGSGSINIPYEITVINEEEEQRNLGDRTATILSNKTEATFHRLKRGSNYTVKIRGKSDILGYGRPWTSTLNIPRRASERITRLPDGYNPHIGIIIGSVVASIIILCLVGFGIYYARLRKRRTGNLDDNESSRKLTTIVRYRADSFVNETPTPSLQLVYPSKRFIRLDAGRIIKNLGSGQFGKVELLECNLADGVTFRAALKRVLGRSVESEQELQSLRNEILTIKRWPEHDNIVKCYGSTPLDGLWRGMEPLLLLEYCELGNLATFLRKGKTDGLKFAVNELLKFACQISSGMQHLARYKIVHRDLAARNVLMKTENQVKIADFGLSRSTSNSFYQHEEGVAHRPRLPWQWLAPEGFSKFGHFTQFSDVWSFGVVIFELFSLGAIPYDGIIDPSDLLDLLEQGRRQNSPAGCPRKIWETVLQCWAFVPDTRPTFEKLYATFRILTQMPEHHVYLNLL